MCVLALLSIFLLHPSIFSGAMSRNRFAFVLHNLSFVDESTRVERWKKDRFTAIREFFEKLNNQCTLVLAPGDYLSLDKTLYPMRTKISFKQFNPSKPAKKVRSFKLFKSVNAARYPYTFIYPYTHHHMVENLQRREDSIIFRALKLLFNI